MANEARIASGLNIRIVDGNIILLDYRSSPSTFLADVSVPMGPTPGAFTVDTFGVDVDLSQLTTPGLAWFHNMDADNYVEYGIYDPADDSFDPFGELLPGECFPIRLSRNFAEQYEGTGTGTSAATKRLRFKANTASCRVRVDAFEK